MNLRFRFHRAGAVMLFLAMGLTARSQTTTRADADGNWNDPSIWNSGLPDITKRAEVLAVGGIRYVTNDTAATAFDLRVGSVNASTGMLTIAVGADLVATNAIARIGSGGTTAAQQALGFVDQTGGSVEVREMQIPVWGSHAQGVYRISDGSLLVRSALTLVQNNAAPSTGRLDIAGGTVSVLSANGIFVGRFGGTGQGIINQTGGLLDVPKMVVGWQAPGQYNLDGGVLNMSTVSGSSYGFMIICDWDTDGYGQMRQTDGTFYLSETNSLQGSPLRIGDKAGGGDYILLGGEIVHRSNSADAGILVGRNETGIGRFLVGDATRSDGEIRETGSKKLGFYVRNHNTADGELRGWGDGFHLTGILRNHGRVIADGYGQDRELNLSRFGSITSTSITNRFDTGWFAVNGGTLRLPDIAVSAGTPRTVNWGLSNLGYINSVNQTLQDVTTGGAMRIALLATDRSDAMLEKGHTIIGLWDFTAQGGLDFASANVTFRYDDLAAAALDLNEADLRLWRNDGSGWTLVPNTSVNTTAKTLTATGLNAFSRFAVGGQIAGPGTVLLVR